jgi:hypothetical protein
MVFKQIDDYLLLNILEFLQRTDKVAFKLANKTYYYHSKIADLSSAEAVYNELVQMKFLQTIDTLAIAWRDTPNLIRRTNEDLPYYELKRTGYEMVNLHLLSLSRELFHVKGNITYILYFNTTMSSYDFQLTCDGAEGQGFTQYFFEYDYEKPKERCLEVKMPYNCKIFDIYISETSKRNKNHEFFYYLLFMPKYYWNRLKPWIFANEPERNIPKSVKIN